MNCTGKPQGIFAPGTEFFVGCNYWASHAGTAMWRDWKPEVVAGDFRVLAGHGLQVLRVFPLWPDFQPIHALTGGGQHFVEMRFGDRPLPDTPAGRAGVEPVMVERFRELCRMAHESNLKLVVGLVTGWMSGRMHVPPAFERVNVLTDPLAIQWQVRMVRHLVRELRNCDAIAAWDLGNECNCMAVLNFDGDLFKFQPESDVVVNVEMGKKGVVLEHSVDRTLIRRKHRNVFPVKKDLSLGRNLKSGDHPKSRCFSASRRSKDGDELTLFHVETEIVDHGCSVELFADMLQADDVLH